MATMEELEQQLAALRDRMDQEAGLRASQDSDLSNLTATLRAQQHSIQALALTQSEMLMQVSANRRGLEDLQREVKEGFRETRMRFEQTQAGLQRIVDALALLIAQNPDE